MLKLTEQESKMITLVNIKTVKRIYEMLHYSVLEFEDGEKLTVSESIMEINDML